MEYEKKDIYITAISKKKKFQSIWLYPILLLVSVQVQGQNLTKQKITEARYLIMTIRLFF